MGSKRSGRRAGRSGTVAAGSAVALIAALLAAALLVAGGTAPAGAGPSEATTTAAAADETARPAPLWEQLPAPENPTDGELSTGVTTVVGAAGDRPALLVGSSSTRPAAPQATVWFFGTTGWTPTTPPGGEGLSVTDAVDDGTRTWLAGWR